MNFSNYKNVNLKEKIFLKNTNKNKNKATFLKKISKLKPSKYNLRLLITVELQIKLNYNYNYNYNL